MDKSDNEIVTSVKKSFGYKPRLMFWHTDDDGNGCAVQIELHPATTKYPGSLMLEFADKDSDDGYCDTDGYHQGGYDWANSLKFRVKLTTIGKMLLVLNGKADHIEEDDNDHVTIQKKNETVKLWLNSERHNKVQSYELKAVVDDTNGGKSG